MAILLYRLTFTGPVHFGATGIGMEVSEPRLRSDGLTSALINAFAVLGEADKAIGALQADPPAFIVSSLFPFRRLETSPPIYALPCPRTPPPAKAEYLRGQGKELKKLTWLTPVYVARWLRTQELTTEELDDLIEHAKALGQDWWKDDLRPRVALDRNSQNSQIWLCGSVTFAEGAGLYGLVKISDEAWRTRLETAFRLLGDMGVGGERTYGMGQFDFHGFEEPGQEWAPFLNEPSDKKLLLSLYHPRDDERPRLHEAWAAWDILESRGHITSGRLATTLKRKRLRFLTEGSVANTPLRGALADVTPDIPSSFGLAHPVYRSGLAFLAPA